MTKTANLLSVSFFAIAIAGCADTALLNTGDQDIDSDALNKRYWINPKSVPIFVCQSTGYPAKTEGCEERTGGSFVVDRVFAGQYGWKYDHVTFDDGKSGYIRDYEKVRFLSEDPLLTAAKEAEGECKQRGEPRIGMSIAEVVATCWGRPAQIKPVNGANGAQQQYVYGSGKSLYFTNGILAKIE
jgi:hypothetical protein